MHASDNSPEDILASIILNHIRLVPNIQRTYSTAKKQLYFLSMKNFIVLRKSEIRRAEIMSKDREIENVNSPKTSGIQGQKMQKYKSIKTSIHNQEALEDSESKFSKRWEKYLQTTNEEKWIECVSCRNCCPSFVLHKKDKCVGCRRR
jgi:dsDNA-specific endonuclease/ATPase MutS2